MIKIDQALFGYMNGHHLLFSSKLLTRQSLRIIEPLSDLSGSEMIDSFDGYLTGYSLPEDNCYALSKTWYAKEMDRPGCVWTHTLFIDFSYENSMPHNICIDDLFQRPNQNINIEQQYSDPLHIELHNEGDILVAIQTKELAISLLLSLNKTNEPIIIPATNANDFNKAFEFLLCKMGLDFFADITFCTGSFSNRSYNRKSLDIQIAPQSLSKNVLRSSEKLGVGTKLLELKDTINEKDRQNQFFFENVSALKSFIFTFGKQYYNRKYLELFSQIFSMITNPTHFNSSEFINIIKSSFSPDEVALVINVALTELFSKSMEKCNAEGIVFLKILLDLCTSAEKSDYDKSLILNTTITVVVDSFWAKFHVERYTLLDELLNSEINHLGERIIEYIAIKISISDFKELICRDSIAYSILIRFNWNLALYEDLWNRSVDYQCEVLRNLSIAFESSSEIEKKDFRAILFLIFNQSNHHLAEYVYERFSDFSIETFFQWSNTNPKMEQFKLWVNLCKYNQNGSLKYLTASNSSEFFREVIKIFDPCNLALSQVESQIWINLYERFCLNCNDTQICHDYATFALIVILKSKKHFPDQFVEHTFKTVHQILADDQMDYRIWDKLSDFLVEINWVNSWDRCKRLRKTAKKYGYDNIR